ncbi:response regulator transcription factor [Actinoplanes sp. RD1]|uniref:response regulator transcription factor n=1 Tax=Actinoplanes sp. RD1 TaxID=3064538 RepID=UPI0027412F0C|nr:LuxR C-terminal-related transcriptional regulator [Actinoplanes sp. RD1]
MRVIVAEDSTLLREGLARLLAEEGHEVPTADVAGVGYLLKDRVSRVEEFLDSLERVHRGGAALDPEVVRQLLARTTRTDPLSRLTAREREVLDRMAQGHTNAAVARQLHVSQSAVEKHVNAIFEKLELTRADGYSRRVLAVLRYLGS